jgi:hypothetical protein
MYPGIHYFKPAIMFPGILYFKPAIIYPGIQFEIMNTGKHYRWFERAKHIFEIMNTGTHYRWFEILKYSLFQIYA